MEKFNHSIKIPQNYKKVAKVLKNVAEDGIGLKDSIYKNNTRFDKNNQRNLALATKIFQKFQIINHIIRTTGILIKEPRLDPWLARVLIYELVWRKDLQHECKPIQTIIKYKKEIKEASESYEGQFESLQPAEKVIKPRYIRINNIIKSTAEVIATLRNDGLSFIPSIQETYSDYLNTVSNLTDDQFLIDFHIKDMLIFGPNFKFFRHEFHHNGIFILQDKASCLAPMLLDPPKGSVVLDMCAAPGMKTNYLANLVGLQGHVYAVEYNFRRYTTLCDIVQSHGLQNVTCMHEDATQITGDKLSDVEYILVDPSCSGSGMINRIDFEQSKPDRLNILAKFQTILLRHALTAFPNVKRVTYSTCSIHSEENEQVVTAVLNAVKDFQVVNLQEKLGPNWNNFGLEEYGKIGTSCLYACPERDFTNGFFVAVFERKKKRKYEEIENTSETNETVEQENNIKEKKKTNKIVTESESTDEQDNEKKTYDQKMEKLTKKSKKSFTEEISETVEEENKVKDKKKKKKTNKIVTESESTDEQDNEKKTYDQKMEKLTKKSKKSFTEEISETVEEENKVKDKKKKKKTNKIVTESESTDEQDNEKKTYDQKMEKLTKKSKKSFTEEISETVEEENKVKDKKKKKKTNKIVTESESTDEQDNEKKTYDQKMEKLTKKSKKSFTEEINETVEENKVKDKKKKKKTNKIVTESESTDEQENEKKTYGQKIEKLKKKSKKNFTEES